MVRLARLSLVVAALVVATGALLVAAQTTTAPPVTTTTTTTAPPATTTAPDTTPPTVTTISPALDSTDTYPEGATILVTFDEDIATGSVTAATFNVTAAATGVIAGSFSFPASNQALFTPTGGSLASEELHTVTLSTPGITDLAGNSLATAFTSTFTTLAIDDTPPTVTAVSPTDGATDVSIETVAGVTFSELVVEAEAVAAFSLTGATSGAVAGTFDVTTVGGTQTAVQFTPNADLTEGDTYTIAVTATVNDLRGNTLAAPFASTFTTTPPDTAVPVPGPQTPISNAVQVSLTLPLSYSFNEPLDTAATEASFSLTPTGGNPATVTITFLNGDTEMSVLPATPLEGDSEYTVAFDAVDLAGNALAFTTTFETRSACLPSCTWDQICGSDGCDPMGCGTCNEGFVCTGSGSCEEDDSVAATGETLTVVAASVGGVAFAAVLAVVILCCCLKCGGGGGGDGTSRTKSRPPSMAPPPPPGSTGGGIGMTPVTSAPYATTNTYTTTTFTRPPEPAGPPPTMFSAAATGNAAFAGGAPPASAAGYGVAAPGGGYYDDAQAEGDYYDNGGEYYDEGDYYEEEPAAGPVGGGFAPPVAPAPVPGLGPAVTYSRSGGGGGGGGGGGPTPPWAK